MGQRLLFTYFLAVCLLGLVCSSTTYVVETRVVLERETFMKWRRMHRSDTENDLKTAVKEMFVEVNDIYNNIDNANLSYKFVITEINILNQNVLPADNDRTVWHDYCLPSFEKWLKRNPGIKTPDISVLFTGFNLRDAASDYLAGIAQIGQVCKPDGNAVIELNGNRKDVLVTAHEIGHVLGINHDGFADYLNGDATNCSMDDGHLMNALLSYTSRNHFYFSDCSVRLLREKVDKLKKESKNCLTDGDQSSVVTGYRTGKWKTPDGICRSEYGSKSFFSRIHHKVYGDDICVNIACVDPRASYKYRIKNAITPQGMRCGKNKQCIKGRCVASPNGDPLMSNTCPFGEPLHPETNKTAYCSLSYKQCNKYQSDCCYTCNKNNPILKMTADEACRARYGKHAFMYRSKYTNYGHAFCKWLYCVTGMDGDQPIVKADKTPDGLACGMGRRCNGNSCVIPYIGAPKLPISCPYGDQPWVGDRTTTCKASIAKQGCSSLKRTCCASCK